MNKLAGETTIREAGTPGSEIHVVLTTHRIRIRAKKRGQIDVVSIMLDQVASCSVAQRSSPWILVAAGLAALGGVLLSLDAENSQTWFFGIAVAIAFVALYLATKKQVIEVTSSNGSVKIGANSMRGEDAIDFIDAVEEAKNNRYLLRRG